QKARPLGEEGLRLFEAGRWAEAYDRFSEADRALHAPTLVLFMARCKRNMGALLEAKQLYREVQGEDLAAGAPTQFREAKQIAQRELDALLPRIPRIELSAPGAPAGTQVLLDAGVAPLNEPVAVDPGSHVAIARTPSGVSVRETIAVEERETKR